MHMGRYHEGLSAFDELVGLLPLLRDYETALRRASKGTAGFPDEPSPVVLNVGRVQAGDWPSTVPGRCDVEGGIAFLPNRTARQIEAGRVAATHFLHREGKVYIRVFPDKPVSSRPLETRMGKGKGDVDHWVACVRPGQICFEIAGVTEDVAKAALARVAHKMPIRCRFVKRRHSAQA